MTVCPAVIPSFERKLKPAIVGLVASSAVRTFPLKAPLRVQLGLEEVVLAFDVPPSFAGSRRFKRVAM
jgi:hypothetical protein